MRIETWAMRADLSLYKLYSKIALTSTAHLRAAVRHAPECM